MIFNQKKALSHVLFWVGIFMFYVFSATSAELFEQSIETTFFKLPLLIIAAYTLNYWQVPCYLNKKKYIAFGVSLIFMILVLTFLSRIIGYYHLDKYCEAGPYPLISLGDFPFYMLSFHFPALMMYFYKVNKDQDLEREKVHKLEKEKIATELKYLKGQLNPHFLFNTLNNLYSYVIMKSSKAPEMILQLSEILDYILYKSQRASVLLMEEVHTIDNYIALEKIKYEERLKISFIKSTYNDQQEITPLILLSIVENAFKHGVREYITKPEISIKLEQFESYLEFSVWNTKTDTKYENKTDDSKKGIGLVNIQRQLDLIYPEKHNLEIDDNKTFFKLKLTLKTH